MIANYFLPGHRLPYSNAGSAISAGDVVVRVSGSSGTIGVAVDDIAATTGTGDLDVEGVFSFPKITGQAFTDGEVVNWDPTNHRLTTATTGNTRAGRVVGNFASAATSANVKINQP